MEEARILRDLVYPLMMFASGYLQTTYISLVGKSKDLSATGIWLFNKQDSEQAVNSRKSVIMYAKQMTAEQENWWEFYYSTYTYM